jgi:beta-galactosidase beta subunit
LEVVLDTPGDDKPYVCRTPATTKSQTGNTGNTTGSPTSHTAKNIPAISPSTTKKTNGEARATPPPIDNKPPTDYHSPLADTDLFSEQQTEEESNCLPLEVSRYLFSEQPTEEESKCLQVHRPKLRVRLIMCGKDGLNLVAKSPLRLVLDINDDITDSKLDGTEEIVIKQGTAVFLLEQAHHFFFNKGSDEKVYKLIKQLRLKWKDSDKQEFFGTPCYL